jgi:adenosylcobinamide-GDP ribazoletransferase
MRPSERPGSEIAAAFAILTRVPIRSASRDATGAAAFGLVGAAVGGLGAIPLVTVGQAAPTLAAVLAVGVMAVASGALHLDGLADTTDALLARDAAQAEIARKDPAIGSGGVVTLILVLATQVTALAALAALPGRSGPLAAGAACVAAGAVSRALPVVVVLLRGEVASRVGLGAWFAERVRPLDGAVVTVTGAVAAVVAAWVVGAIAFGAAIVAGAVAGLAIGLSLVRARRQIDGDVLGATVELCFAVTVAVAAITMAVTWPTL